MGNVQQNFKFLPSRGEKSAVTGRYTSRSRRKACGVASDVHGFHPFLIVINIYYHTSAWAHDIEGGFCIIISTGVIATHHTTINTNCVL